jgi:hypothetical protein
MSMVSNILVSISAETQSLQILSLPRLKRFIFLTKCFKSDQTNSIGFKSGDNGGDRTNK